MLSRDKDDSQLPVEKGHVAFFLARWRGQLLIDQSEGDADGIELDKRVLDYYLDLYSELNAFHPPLPLTAAESRTTAVATWAYRHNDTPPFLRDGSTSAFEPPIRASQASSISRLPTKQSPLSAARKTNSPGGNERNETKQSV
jgi:hypothetical protein